MGSFKPENIGQMNMYVKGQLMYVPRCSYKVVSNFSDAEILEPVYIRNSVKKSLKSVLKNILNMT